MNEPGKTIIGIVVGEDSQPEKYVWSNETYIGHDGRIKVTSGKAVKIGDWVTVSFIKQEADRYFPPVKSPDTPGFYSQNYQLITPIYPTQQDGRTVEVVLNCYLTAGQTVINHHFFGLIYNDRIKAEEGLWKVTIRRVLSMIERPSVWVVKQIDPIEREVVENEKTVIGIVVTPVRGNKAYVWCRESPPGLDGLIYFPIGQEVVVQPGTWIQMKFTSGEFSRYFVAGAGGNVERFTVSRYNKITAIHETYLYRSTIGLKLECYVEGSTVIKDIWHPFVGTIINNVTLIEQSGKYSITIVRANKKNAKDGSESVWFLNSYTLISLAPQQMEQVRHDPFVMPHAAKLHGLDPPSLFEQERCQNGSPGPQPVVRPPYQQPSPAHQNRPFSPPTFPPTRKRMGMITRIAKDGNTERIFVWLMEDHREACLFLPVAAEKYCLELGTVFAANFREKGSKCFSNGPVDTLPQISYETRSQAIGVDVRIYTEKYLPRDNSQRYPRVWHEHFGVVTDNRQKLAESHAKIKYHMWIRRAEIEKYSNQYGWVVVEQITG